MVSVLGLTLGLKALREGLTVKAALCRSFEKRLDAKSRRRALSDGHARRRPRPCGLTIHTCVGCPYTCLYCYIDDLGFPRGKAHPYSLSGDEWLLSLTSNPFFLPGLYGTYLSFGSVCEPLHHVCLSKTLEYLSQVRARLDNPCQVATKSALNDEVVDRLANSMPRVLNVLVTVVSIKRSRLLEPSAPSPFERFESLRRLVKRGIPAFLFLRPVLPGLEDEVDDILGEAKQAGVLGVVIGGLRLSERIFHRLKSAGIEVPGATRRRGLVDIAQRDLKNLIIEAARSKGLVPFRSACCATTYSIVKLTGLRLPCTGLCYASQLCTHCPVDCLKALPRLDEDEAIEAATMALGIRPRSIRFKGAYVEVGLESKAEARLREGLELLKLVFRRKVRLLPAQSPLGPPRA